MINIRWDRKKYIFGSKVFGAWTPLGVYLDWKRSLWITANEIPLMKSTSGGDPITQLKVEIMETPVMVTWRNSSMSELGRQENILIGYQWKCGTAVLNGWDRLIGAADPKLTAPDQTEVIPVMCSTVCVCMCVALPDSSGLLADHSKLTSGS